MADVKELELWIAYAEEDFGSAKALLQEKKPFFSAACFHAQQCAEKYLKALLILKDFDFPKTHDLVTLDTLCNQNGILTGFDKGKFRPDETCSSIPLSRQSADAGRRRRRAGNRQRSSQICAEVFGVEINAPLTPDTDLSL